MKIMEKVKKVLVLHSAPEMYNEKRILRFLKARNFHFERTVDMILKDIVRNISLSNFIFRNGEQSTKSIPFWRHTLR
jgi:hypothetical protein